MSIARKQVTAIVCCTVLCVVAAPSEVFAFPNRAAQVQVIDTQTREVQSEWTAFNFLYTGGLNIAVGDMDGDGTDEVVVAQSGGADAKGVVRVFTSQGKELAEMKPFKKVSGEELSIVMGDVDGDGNDELLVSRPESTSSTIAVLAYSKEDGLAHDADATTVEAFPEFERGVRVAVGDVLGDDKEEIIAATGEGVFPLIRILDEHGVMRAPDISPFGEVDTQGLTVEAVHFGGTAEKADIAVGYAGLRRAQVKHYDIDDRRAYPVLAEYEAFTKEHASGTSLVAVNLDGDGAGTEELGVMPATDRRAEMKAYVHNGSQTQWNGEEVHLFFEDDFRGGVRAAAGQADKDAHQELFVVGSQQPQRGDLERGERYVEVNLTDQVSLLWEGGYLRNSYLISSGLSSTPTPTGDFEILKKIESHVYDGRPEYYYPNTKWNLRFKNSTGYGNYYFHTAYWHNNFGNPMSHGCINMQQEEAEFLYSWADLGTPVWIHH